MNTWMRTLIVTFESSTLKNSMTFGINNDLAISVSLTKYMSTVKDTGVIEIKNLTYNEITQLIMGKYYNVSVWCGYQEGVVNKIFDGGVIYISNRLESDKTNTVIILVGSKLVARYGQSRLNLTLNSGINMYSALKYICDKAGIPNSNVSEAYKQQILEHALSLKNETVASYMEKFLTSNNSAITNADGILESAFSIYDSKLTTGRVLTLDNDSISLTGGYPQLTTEGLSLHMLPTFNFVCGDTIKIDNSIVDVSISDKSEITEGKTLKFSQTGQYVITQMQYNLSNRANTYDLELLCKNRNYITNLLGGG